MYLRTTQRRNRDGSVVRYHQLAETVWDPARGRPQARIVHNFGRADTLDLDVLRRLARSIARVANAGVEVPEEFGGGVLPDLEIESCRPLGGVHVARALWEELGIGPALRRHQGSGRRRADHETALFALVANRLLEPVSKLACHEHWLAEGVHLPEAASLTLEHLYRAMDFLMEDVEALEQEVFFRTADLFRLDVDLVFWDTTTVWFEVDEEDPGGEEHGGRSYPALRQRGHSKEHRDQAPQVVVGLAVTRDGMPVRSWVFPGNTVDATTVRTIKEGLREWKLGRVVLVGDAGMDSADNRRVLAEGLGHYVLAVPAGKLKEVQEEVLTRPGRYREVRGNLHVKEVVVGGDGERRRRYVVCRNLEEAERQRRHRLQVLEELALELQSLGRSKKDHPKRACELLASGRYGPYLSRDERGRLRVDRTKVRKAARMDGRFVLLTNDDTLDAEDVGVSYKAMGIIESCFRRMKTSGLRIRPVYHWTPHRITAHVKLCVLALLLQRAAEIRAGDSWRNLAAALEQIQAVRYRVADRTIVQATRPTPRASEILATLGVAKPKNILAIEAPAAGPSKT
jgi:transposase